jgi:peptidoglycan/xylan/chitin deacetylase (PgdA/CDA1 family)
LSEKKSAILTYHSLDNSGSRISISPSRFRDHLRALAASGFRVVPLANVRDRAGSIAITFDDGYSNFLTEALPLLNHYRMPATVFIVSGFCGGYNEWPSRVHGLPRLRLLNWDEVREVSRFGATIGAHTVHHANLADASRAEAEREMRECKRAIEDRIGLPVGTFAYPYGAAAAAVRDLAKREFHLACGTRLRFTDSRSDPFDLPRIDAGYLRRPFWMANLGTPAGAAYIAACGGLDALRRATVR